MAESGAVQNDLGRKRENWGDSADNRPQGKARRRIRIDEALRWAYRQELPKVGRAAATAVSGSSWAAISRFGALMTLIDVSPNRFGVVADFTDGGGPDPDAIEIAEAVARLAELAFEAGDDVLGDVEGLTPIEREECNARGFLNAAERCRQLPVLVARRAVLGGVPDWQSHGAVKRAYETGPNGKPVWRLTVTRPGGFALPDVEVEIDGYDARRQRPKTGAWRRCVLTPDPALLAEARCEYQAYVYALGVLVGDLDGKLVGIDLQPTDLPLWPWEGERARAEARVLSAR